MTAMRKLAIAALLSLGISGSLAAQQQWGTWSPGRGAFGDWHWASPVADLTALNLLTGTPGECIAIMDAGAVYCWSGDSAAWVAAGGGGSGDTWKTINPSTGSDLVASGESELHVNGGTGVTVTSSGGNTLTIASTITDTDTDDQTAAEVPITDAGSYYTGTQVEAALQEIGPTMTDARAPLAHTQAASTITDFTAASQTIGDARYSLLSHNHAHSTLTGLTTGDAGHTQFALLAGRAGGQALYGGTVTGDTLQLFADSADAAPYFKLWGTTSGPAGRIHLKAGGGALILLESADGNSQFSVRDDYTGIEAGAADFLAYADGHVRFDWGGTGSFVCNETTHNCTLTGGNLIAPAVTATTFTGALVGNADTATAATTATLATTATTANGVAANSVVLGTDTTGGYAASSTEGGAASSVAANSVALGTDTTGGYAASTTEGGPATTATALAANGGNCSAGAGAGGTSASGVAEDCTTYAQVAGDLGNTGASPQVTATHLAAALPVNQGGTGTASTLAGLVRGNASAMTAAEISGDCTTSGSNAITCTKTSGTSFGAIATTSGATDDTVPVGNGTTFDLKALANCTDTGGNHLNYTASTNAFSCGTSGDGAGGISGLGSVDNVAVRSDGTGGATAQGSPFILSDEASGVITISPNSATTNVDIGIAPKGAGKFLLGASTIYSFANSAGFVGTNNLSLSNGTGGLSNGQGIVAKRYILSDGSNHYSLNIGGSGVDFKDATAATYTQIGASALNAYSGSNRTVLVYPAGVGYYAASGMGLYWNSSATEAYSATPDLGLSRIAAGALGIGTGANGNHSGFFEYGGTCVVATDQTNATTTPQTWACYNVTSGSVAISLAAGRTYIGDCVGYVSDSTAADGASIDFDSSTATATTFRAASKLFSATVAEDAYAQPTALATDIVSGATLTGASSFEVDVFIKVNAAGTFQPRFFQSGHTAGTLTLAAGSRCRLTDATP